VWKEILVASRNFEVPNAQTRDGNGWFADGLDRLWISVALLWLAGMQLIPSRYEGLVTRPAVMVLCVFLVTHAPAVRWLKSRVTHVRINDTSWMPWKREDAFRQYREMLLIAAVCVTFNFDASAHLKPPWISLVVLAAGLGFLWGRFGFSLPMAGLALSGVVVVSLSLSQYPAMACFLITLAFLYLIKGAMELRQYLHAHPALPA
jgi:hypothetical protein